MAVLPWGHGRSQANGSVEKSKAPTLDWFSRSSTEPSRQAINQLMKQHSRGGSGGSLNARGKSRAGTPTSQTSQMSQHRSAPSKDSKAEGKARVSSERSVSSHSRSSTPTARPSTPARAGTPALERSDSSSKSLFQKGGLLRRTGSKMGLNLTTSPTSTVVSPVRPSSSRAGLRGWDPASPVRDDSRRPSISPPFDFAHIMHGDIAAFTGLGRIDESDLASQFDAIQARYRLTNDLGEPYPQTPETITPTVVPAPEPDEEPTALPQISPSTPPPAPPPKDRATAESTPATDIRTSKSVENFSRPNPRSPIRPSSCHLHQLTAAALAVNPAEPISSKPLPQVPNGIHAVSTEDDTARMLITAPLPPPPAPRHHRQSSSRSSLRHMSTFPSSRYPQTSGSTQDGQLLNIKEEEGLPRPHSDYEVSQLARHRRSSKRDSSDTQPVNVEDWEVAIDSAWDLEDEAELSSVDDAVPRSGSVQSKAGESLLTIEQPEQENASLPSTPLMTMSPARRPQSRASAERPPSTSGLKGNRSSLVGLGLGMEGQDKPEPASRVSRLPVLEIVTSNHGPANGSPRLTRSAYSAISHSSSQESIILSIASSIMSTQRSSVSSVSVSDSPFTSKPDRLSVANSANSPALNAGAQKTARPDSSCLPSSLLKQMNAETQKAARPDSTCLPSMPPSQRNSVVLKPIRPESVCLPQEVLATFPVPEAKQRRAVNSSAKARGSVAKRIDDIEANALVDATRRASQASRDSVTQRGSSVLGAEVPPTGRQRSNTQNSRTRPGRVSYSLFPAAGAAAAAPNHDADIATS